MPKEAVSTTKVEPESGAEFMAEAPAAHRPPSQLMRELMREFVQRQREAREYEGFLRHKVGAARSSMRAVPGGPKKRLKPNFPHGVRMQGTRREDYLDAGGRARP